MVFSKSKIEELITGIENLAEAGRSLKVWRKGLPIKFQFCNKRFAHRIFLHTPIDFFYIYQIDSNVSRSSIVS